MSYYAIGIGGTGAKCLEALVHMCAAGLLPNAKDGGGLYLLFVDPDKSNGSLERALTTVQQYMRCRETVDFGDSPAFQTKIEVGNPDVWSPFTNTVNPRLDSFFSKPAIPQEHQQLFDVLYTKKEQATSLEMGFRGHPAIGAAVMAHTVDLDDEEPWKTFKTKVQRDLSGGEGRIFLFGSIFGGTGASGLPTITELIYNQLQSMGVKPKSSNIKLGAAIMLPYFTFNSNNDEELQARAAEFMVNSQSALKYYYEKILGKNLFDSLYVLGNQSMQDLPHFNLGGKEQKNPPHLVELYAALGALDFFQGSFDELGSVNMIARNEECTTWEDIPEVKGLPASKKRLAALTRCAYAYLCNSGYYDILDKTKTKSTKIKEPWYLDFFKAASKGSAAESQVWEGLDCVKGYFAMYLKWMASLHLEQVSLVDAGAFADIGNGEATIKQSFDGERFGGLIRHTAAGENPPENLFALLERMCETSPSEFTGNTVGRFVSALFSSNY